MLGTLVRIVAPTMVSSTLIQALYGTFLDATPGLSFTSKAISRKASFLEDFAFSAGKAFYTSWISMRLIFHIFNVTWNFF